MVDSKRRFPYLLTSSKLTTGCFESLMLNFSFLQTFSQSKRPDANLSWLLPLGLVSRTPRARERACMGGRCIVNRLGNNWEKGNMTLCTTKTSVFKLGHLIRKLFCKVLQDSLLTLFRYSLEKLRQCYIILRFKRKIRQSVCLIN